MKRLAAILAVPLTVALTGCTQYEISWHVQKLAQIATEKDPVKKQAEQAQYETIVKSYASVKTFATTNHSCPEWFDVAMDAGFTPEQWMWPVSYIMFHESRCDQYADNGSSSARGLMQELEFWASRCGGTYDSLYDPYFNLRCAAQVIYPEQGWNAWSTYPG